MITNTFICDELLKSEDICNLTLEKKRIKAGVEQGEKMLVYGRRNFGKTSVVKNVVARDWLNDHPEGLFFYADLYGVKDLRQLTARLASAFSDALRRTFPVRSRFGDMLNVIKSLRPVSRLSSDGDFELSFEMVKSDKQQFLAEMFQKMLELRQKGIPHLIVIDEFQEIERIDEAQGLLRDIFQSLYQMPMILMGSKKHLLSKIFMTPSAPFFNWGTHIEFGAIPYDEYCDYMNARFKNRGQSIDLNTAIVLQDRMTRVPEAINRVCRKLFFSEKSGLISVDDINLAIHEIVDERRSATEEYLAHFTSSEERLLTIFAKEDAITHPSGKKYAEATASTVQNVRKIVKKLEDQAVLYRDVDASYTFADPFVRLHLRAFR